MLTTQRKNSKVKRVSKERIDDLEDRVRLLEQAVFELSTMAKYLKYAAIALFASLGVDIQGSML